jgi:hypothetical protein
MSDPAGASNLAVAAPAGLSTGMEAPIMTSEPARIRRGRRDGAMTTEPVPWPVCWRIHQDDAAQFASEKKHCETRKCREPVAMVTWRYWRSSAVGRLLLSEHLVCVQHGREFAGRHGIDLEPAPAKRSLR